MDCQSEILLNLLAFFFFTHPPSRDLHNVQSSQQNSSCETLLTFEACIIHIFFFSPSSVHELVFIFCVCVCFILFGFFFIIILLFGACCVAQPLPLLPFHPPISSKIKEKKEQSFFSPPEFFMWDWACKGKKNVKCYRLAACWVPSGFFSIVMLK